MHACWQYSRGLEEYEGHSVCLIWGWLAVFNEGHWPFQSWPGETTLKDMRIHKGFLFVNSKSYTEILNCSHSKI